MLGGGMVGMGVCSTLSPHSISLHTRQPMGHRYAIWRNTQKPLGLTYRLPRMQPTAKCGVIGIIIFICKLFVQKANGEMRGNRYYYFYMQIVCAENLMLGECWEWGFVQPSINIVVYYYATRHCPTIDIVVYYCAVRRADYVVGSRRRISPCRIVCYPYPLVRKDGIILDHNAANAELWDYGQRLS